MLTGAGNAANLSRSGAGTCSAACYAHACDDDADDATAAGYATVCRDGQLTPGMPYGNGNRRSKMIFRRLEATPSTALYESLSLISNKLRA